jgi:hypothetical protein
VTSNVPENQEKVFILDLPFRRDVGCARDEACDRIEHDSPKPGRIATNFLAGTQHITDWRRSSGGTREGDQST